MKRHGNCTRHWRGRRCLWNTLELQQKRYLHLMLYFHLNKRKHEQAYCCHKNVPISKYIAFIHWERSVHFFLNKCRYKFKYGPGAEPQSETNLTETFTGWLISGRGWCAGQSVIRDTHEERILQYNNLHWIHGMLIRVQQKRGKKLPIWRYTNADAADGGGWGWGIF